jgi:hypothetical protein
MRPITMAGRNMALGICLLAALPAFGQAQGAQYAVSVSGGRAFMVDTDDADPAGSSSFSAAFERRRPGRSLSTGIEAGFHRFLVIRQDLAPDITGWASILEDTRQAWRLTPFLRWRTRGDVSLSAQVGGGLYVQRSSYFQQERELGELVVDARSTSTRARPGLNIGIGLEIAPGSSPVALALGFRTHAVFSGGDGFHTAEIGIVWRGRARTGAVGNP